MQSCLLRLNSASSFVTFFESNDKLHVLRDVRIESKSPDKIEKVVAEDCFPAIFYQMLATQHQKSHGVAKYFFVPGKQILFPQQCFLDSA